MSSETVYMCRVWDHHNKFWYTRSTKNRSFIGCLRHALNMNKHVYCSKIMVLKRVGSDAPVPVAKFNVTEEGELTKCS